MEATAEVAIGHQHDHHAVARNWSCVPPAFGCRFDHDIAFARNIDAAKLGSDTDEAIEQQALCANVGPEACGTSASIDHHLCPQLMSVSVLSIINVLVEF
jgi:hypothetical protein